MSKGPYLPNVEAYAAAGLDPKTGLPLKFAGTACALKESLKQLITIQDEQDAINRFRWYNLPPGINSQLLEKMLYYRGSLCFFYFEELEQFFIMPYALDGGTDYYGRFNYIHPVPWSEGDEEVNKSQAEALSRKHLKVYHDVADLEELTLEDLMNAAIIIKDRTEGTSQQILPRATLHQGIIELESECLPFMRTALLNSTGIKGMRVGNQDESSNVLAANRTIKAAALNGDTNIPIVGSLDFQELTSGGAAAADEFLMAMQSIDNIRLGFYGLDNGGIFQKRARKLAAEQEMNSSGGTVGLVLQDGLAQRQSACNIINSLFGMGIWCDVAECANEGDNNMDGRIDDAEINATMQGDQTNE